MKYFNKTFIYYFFFTLLTLTFFNFLNYTFKTPNDGSLYVAAADFFLKNNVLINPISSFDNIISPFPTTQVGIVFFLVFLKFLFGQLWNIAYLLIISFLWSLTLYYLLNFLKKKYKDKNIFLLISFTLILFINYDNINTAASYYNEAIYYPFYLIIFIKILEYLSNNNIKKLDNLIIIIGLCLLSYFRLQNFIFIASICLYLILHKEFKIFLKFSIFTLASLISIYFLLSYLPTLNTINSSDAYFIKTSLNYEFFDQFKYDLIKNIKIQLALYSHFSNITKVVNIIIPNNFLILKEFLYLIFSLFVIIIFIYQFKVSRLRKIYQFFLIYLLLSHLFSFFIFDQDTRYYLYYNVLILFVIYDFIFDKFKKINLKYLIPLFLIPFLFILIYGVGYFINKNKYENVYISYKLVKNLVSNRGSYLSRKDIFISDFQYSTFWLTKRPSFRSKYFFDNEIGKRIPNSNYYFIGKENEINALNEKEKIKSFSQISLEKDNNFGIWKIILND